MTILIFAIQELVIKDVVLYADKNRTYPKSHKQGIALWIIKLNKI